MNVSIPKSGHRKAGSKKDRQIMAHRGKHERYARELRREFNKKRRNAKQRRKEEKKRVKKFHRVKILSPNLGLGATLV